MYEHEKEDNGYIRDLVLKRMEETFASASPAVPH
jgi:hypothetical protein